MDNKYIKIIKGTPLFHGMSDEEIAQFLRPDGSGIKKLSQGKLYFSRRRQDRLFWHTSGGQGAYRT